jgi:hypothetical protein
MPENATNGDGRAPGGPQTRAATAEHALRVRRSRFPFMPAWLTWWFRGWTREHFSAENLVSFFKTLLWVGPLTVLIWIYAERQQQFTQSGVTLPVEVVSSDPTKAVRITRPSDGNVVLTIRGPKGEVEKLIERNKSPDNPAVQIRLEGTGSASDSRLVNISADRIGLDKRFADAGILIVSAQPVELQVMVEPYVERDVTVRSLQPSQSREVTFEPPTVKLRGPESVMREQERSVTGLVVYADLAGRINPQAQPDKELKLDEVKLSLPTENKNVTIVPATVTARVKPSGVDEYEIPTVVVRVAATDEVLRDFEVVPVPPIHNVRVSGPKELIDKLRPPAPAPRAFVEIRSNPPPTAGNENDADVTYDFPPGIVVKDAPKTVKVGLRAR